MLIMSGSEPRINTDERDDTDFFQSAKSEISVEICGSDCSSTWISDKQGFLYSIIRFFDPIKAP